MVGDVSGVLVMSAPKTHVVQMSPEGEPTHVIGFTREGETVFLGVHARGSACRMFAFPRSAIADLARKCGYYVNDLEAPDPDASAPYG